VDGNFNRHFFRGFYGTQTVGASASHGISHMRRSYSALSLAVLYRHARNKVLAVEPLEARSREEHGDRDFFDPHAPRGFALLAVPPPKLYFACAYTIPPATQANGYLKFLCDAYVSATKNRQELRIEGRAIVLFRSQQNKKDRNVAFKWFELQRGRIVFLFLRKLKFSLGVINRINKDR